MTTFELKYDPFNLKTDFYIDAKETSLDCFGTGRNVRLREYINSFFPAAIKKSNLGPGSDCELQFYGTQDAFEDVKAAYQKYKSDGVKIELPEYKPYPNNFNEMNILIDEKKKNYAEQIEQIKEKLINPSAKKSNVEPFDVVKQFDRDKEKIEQIYCKNLEEANSEIKKTKDKVNTEVDIFSQQEINLLQNDSKHEKKSVLIFFSGDIYLCEKEKFKESYNKITDYISSTFEKSCGELTALYVSLFEKIETALYSGFEAIYKDYTALYQDFFVLNYDLQKNNQSNTVDIKGTITNKSFDELNIIKARDFNVRRGSGTTTITTDSIPMDEIIALVKATTSSCQEYFDSVLESTQKDFLLKIEECKAFYLERLLELQDTVKEKLTLTKHIEQEITVLEKQIESLDELQNDINKVAEG